MALWICPGRPRWAGTRWNIHPLTPIMVINHTLSASSIYYNPWYPPCSIYVPGSLVMLYYTSLLFVCWFWLYFKHVASLFAIFIATDLFLNLFYRELYIVNIHIFHCWHHTIHVLKTKLDQSGFHQLWFQIQIHKQNGYFHRIWI